jgi:hypothetical protein
MKVEIPPFVGVLHQQTFVKRKMQVKTPSLAGDQSTIILIFDELIETIYKPGDNPAVE